MTTKNETDLRSINFAADLDKLAHDNFAKECMELLKEFQRGDISFMEFRVATALKSVEVLDSYRCKTPPSKPVELLKFEDDKKSDDWAKLSLEKKQAVQKKVLGYQDVRRYVDELSKIGVTNQSNTHYLEETAVILLKAGMIKSADHVWDVIVEHGQMSDYQPPEWYEKEKAKAQSQNSTAEVSS